MRFGMQFGIVLPTLCLAPDDGGGNGGGGSGAGSGSGSGSENHGGRQNPADIVARYNGDAVRLASDLSASEARNYDLRDKNRDLRHEVETLKKQVPGEGTLVLTKEQAAQWEAFQKLNLKPDEITAQLAAGKTAIEENAAHKRATALEKAAKIANFKPGVLKLLGKDLNVEVREVEVTDAEGKITKVERAFVVSKDGDKETLTGLREFFKAQGEDVLASLEAGEGDYSGGYSGGYANGGANGGNAGGAGGVHYPAQGAGGGNPGQQKYQPKNRYAHNLPQKEN
jgi:hypothetical protein